MIVEATGNQAALEAALAHSPAGATLLLLGLPYASRPFSFESIAAYDKAVVGSVGSTAADFEAALALLPRLPLAPFLRTRFPLSEFARAWEASKRGDVLKVLLDVA